MFIDQATRNGTRPGTPEGAEPALQYSQYPARLVSTMSADARQSEPLAAGRGWGETSTSASALKHERARMPLPCPARTFLGKHIEVAQPLTVQARVIRRGEMFAL